MGENGAGKSHLNEYGIRRPDTGQRRNSARWLYRRAHLPRRAQDFGVGTVFQEAPEARLSASKANKALFKEKYPEITVVDVVNDKADPSYAPTAYAQALQAHPDVVGIGGTTG